MTIYSNNRFFKPKDTNFRENFSREQGAELIEKLVEEEQLKIAHRQAKRPGPAG